MSWGAVGYTLDCSPGLLLWAFIALPAGAVALVSGIRAWRIRKAPSGDRAPIEAAFVQSKILPLFIGPVFIIAGLWAVTEALRCRSYLQMPQVLANLSWTWWLGIWPAIAIARDRRCNSGAKGATALRNFERCPNRRLRSCGWPSRRLPHRSKCRSLVCDRNGFRTACVGARYP